MSLSTWFAFVLASAAMGLIPGPGVTSIVGYALSFGRRTALASVAGMMVGNVLAMTLSLAGAGAVLASSATAFTVLKWAGAIYLIALGVLALVRAREAPATAEAPPPPIAARTAFWSNVAVGTFHPKTIVFFVAFVPQFISAEGSYLAQAALLVATFAVVVGATDSAYALTAARARGLLRKPKAMLWSKRAGGGVLIAAGVATAAARN
jgi:threonine/homoserine/homoserine lactone efflux protein